MSTDQLVPLVEVAAAAHYDATHRGAADVDGTPLSWDSLVDAPYGKGSYRAMMRPVVEAVLAESEGDSARLAAVAEIHSPVDAVHTQTGKRMQICAGCGRDRDWMPWPCPTVRAIQGGGRS